MTEGIAELIFAPGAETSSIVSTGAQTVLNVPMPLHGGPPRERFFRGDSARVDGVFHLVNGAEFVSGAAVAPASLSPRESAAFLYDEMFRIIGEQPLCRVWNYIPHINGSSDGEENYREFNAGRLDSFRRRYGVAFRPQLPAASALGSQGGGMALAFLAGNESPEHFENPEQVPACDYPADYGAQPPAFARGTRIQSKDRIRWFLAGTASIKGHATVGTTAAEQMALTLDNIRLMERTMALPAGVQRSWKVFVRNVTDIAEIRALFTAAYPDDAGSAMFLHADICRSSLLVEIEGVFSLGTAR